MNEQFEQYVEKLSRSLAVLAVRNTFLEDLHAGKVPSSEIGDYSDVKVVTPTEDIPWNEVSRLNDQEMKKLMKQVVDILYTILLPLLSGDESQKLDRLIAYGEECALQWDKAEIEKGLGLSHKNTQGN